MKTLLCVPGHDKAKVRKARTYGADRIMFDLEDSVPKKYKEKAIEIVSKEIRHGDAVRVNSALHIDDKTVAYSAGAEVWVPKLENFEYLQHMRHYQYVIIVESAELVLRLPELLTLRPEGLCGLAFGAADFAASARCQPTSPLIEYARAQVALIAAALGVESYNSPCTSLHAGVAAAVAWQAARDGYTYQGVIHPDQIEAVREADVDWKARAQWVLDNYAGDGVAVVGDTMLAPPMALAAKRLLER